MENNDHISLILLGRLFLKTFKNKIDIHSGIFHMEFDSKIVKFNIYDDNHVCLVGVLDSLA